ncbi:MAG: RES domain-containing protein [Actinomycetota bacterium]
MAIPGSSVAFRVADRRWPFLWTDDTQPEGRWHGIGEGPCHYLSNTAEAAWAEYLRHAGIRDRDEIEDVERSLWMVLLDPPTTDPDLPDATLTGNRATYPRCQEQARRLRARGAVGLRAPAAALLPPGAAVYGVSASGQHLADKVAGLTYAMFGYTERLRGLPVAEGRPDPSVLPRVRHL